MVIGVNVDSSVVIDGGIDDEYCNECCRLTFGYSETVNTLKGCGAMWK